MERTTMKIEHIKVSSGTSCTMCQGHWNEFYIVTIRETSEPVILILCTNCKKELKEQL